MTDSAATTPLFNTAMDQQTNPPSAVASGAITALSALKVILGASCVIAPQLAGRLFLLHVPPQAVIMARLFGSSCTALGALTWDLNRRAGTDLRRVVAFNIAADAVDVVSCGVGYASGMYGLGAFSMLGGGCVVLAVLGAVGFKGL